MRLLIEHALSFLPLKVSGPSLMTSHKLLFPLLRALDIGRIIQQYIRVSGSTAEGELRFYGVKRSRSVFMYFILSITLIFLNLFSRCRLKLHKELYMKERDWAGKGFVFGSSQKLFAGTNCINLTKNSIIENFTVALYFVWLYICYCGLFFLIDHWCVHSAGRRDHGTGLDGCMQGHPTRKDPHPDQSRHGRARGIAFFPPIQPQTLIYKQSVIKCSCYHVPLCSQPW